MCHGVILRLAPQVRIIDITHGVAACDVAGGALLLAQAVPYLPVGVQLAVVDPGVGSARRAVVVVAAGGTCLVGPDNGLLLPAADRLGGVVSCYALQNPELALPAAGAAQGPSRTFHGRDIFAPAAAHLALGVAAEEFGEEVAPASLIRLARAAAVVESGYCRGAVSHIDHFANLQTTIAPSQAASVGLRPGAVVQIEVDGRPRLVAYGETFGSVEVGEAVVIEDSHGVLALCINQGEAAAVFGAGVGSVVTMRAGDAGSVGQDLPAHLHDPENPRQGDGGEQEHDRQDGVTSH